MVPIDVMPRLDLDLTLGLIQSAGRTLVPATAHAFEFVRASLASARGCADEDKDWTVRGTRGGTDVDEHLEASWLSVAVSDPITSPTQIAQVMSANDELL